MKFVQTISFTSTQIDEIQAMAQEFESTIGDNRGFGRTLILKDRDRENGYLIVAEFESYDVAMENSARPETDAFAQKMAALVDGEVSYGNYDVVDER